MLLTEEKINEIILEETLKYLEEIKGSMSPKEFEKFLKYVPFTKVHRSAMAKSAEGRKDLDVYELVMGGLGPSFKGKKLSDWPENTEEKMLIARWIHKNFVGIEDPSDIVDPKTGKHKLKWNIVQKLVKKKFLQEPEVKQVRKQIFGVKEIIRKEVIKYLKENE